MTLSLVSVQRDIAIVGMGCMFPGAANIERFWSLICSASSVARQAPRERWPDHPQTFVNEQLTADKIVSSRGCFVDPLPPFSAPTLNGLDTSGLDPLFHLLLHAGHQAWNDAVTEDVNRSKCGVILGQIVLPSETLSNWSDELLARATQAAWGDEPTPFTSFNPLNRHVAGLPAGLLAADLGFGGGASCLDAACASSLYAIKLAVDELREGRRDAMLVGGLSRPDSLYTQMGFSHLHALSPTGNCQPFSRNADGLLVGEGAGMVVLKRLEDALRAGDHIYATLPGIGLSNDIGGNLMHPDSEGQLRAMRQAYEHAGWQPESVGLIECHGTGTPTGDRVELASLQQLWSASAADDTPRCVIGSVKSNIGHLLTAAGIAGLIKVLLAMQAKKLPPSANADQPLADLQSTDSRFAILQRAQPWPVRDDGIPRRAAVSAFGFGGINAHVLVEEWYSAPARSVLPAAVRSRATKALPSRSGTSSADAAAQAMTAASTATTAEPIAIVGLSGQFGEWTDPASLTARLLGAGEAERAAGPRRVFNPRQQLGDAGKGYPLQSINVDSLRFRIPPRELAQLLPQQALMLQTAADALDDAQIATDHDAHLNSGVYIGIELDMNTCNFHWRWQCEQQMRDGPLGTGQRAVQSVDVLNALREAATPYLNADRTMGALGGIVASRIARWLGAGAGSFTVSCEQASALKALQIAMRALRRQEINLAVVGGVDLNAEPRGLDAQERLKEHAGIAQGPFGEGAGAVVLKRHSDAIRDGDRIYCVLRGVSQRCAAPLPNGGFAQDDPKRRNVAGAQPRAALREHYQLCLDEALADANMQTVQPGLVELSGAQSRSPSALQALTTSIKERRAQSTASTQIPAASLSDEVLGDSAAASGIASLLRVALCLHYRTLPAAPELSSQGSQRNSHSHSNSDSSDQSPDQSYYRPQQSRYWLRNRVEGPRQALLCVDTLIGGTMQVIAEGVASDAQAPVAAVGALLCVYGRDTQALLQAIEQCQSFIAQHPQWAAAAIADHWHQQNSRAQDALTVSIVASDATRLTALLGEAQICVANKVRAHTADLFFEPQPLTANNGRLAFVFPGSGNHYRGMSQQLSLPAAATLDDNDSRNESSLDQFAGGAFWRDPPVADHDHTKLLCSQIWSSTFVYDIFRHLGVRAQAMIGYSLGETASLFASGCWPDRDTMLARIRDTDLFTKHLGSGFAAVRKHWGLQDGEPVDWRVAMVQTPVSAVREALAGAFADQRVYLLIINTAKECVLGGDGATLARLASELGVVLHPISGVISVHCEVLQPVADAYRELHLQRTSAVKGIRHYSCHLGRRYEVNRESAADSILGMALQAFDFNALIETAYADGVRLFVETGPGDACTRMIDDILGERPHLACSASHSRGHEHTQLLRALAGITAHGVTLPTAAWTQHHALIDRRNRKHQQLALAPGLDGWRVPQRACEAAHSIAIGAASHVYAGVDAAEFDSKPTHLQAGLRAQLPSVAIVPTTHAAALAAAPSAANEQWSAPIMHGMLEMLESRHQAHQAFLQLQNSIESSLSEAVQLRLSAAAAPMSGYSASHLVQTRTAAAAPLVPIVPSEEIAFDRHQCLQFAIGGIAEVLGVEFADIDQHPTRVRLPAEPLMLVDRIIAIEGEAGSLGPARIVTEHDIHAGAWYLDGGRIPTCIAVEAGQADLFLSAWLGIDRVTKGNAVYRLLDANITFHDQMPGPGARIRYDIRINRFFTLGATHLFQFEFDASVDGRPLLTMRDGSAGFFTAAELAAGQGIVDPKIPLAALDSNAIASDHNTWLAPSLSGAERYSDQQMDALRDGDLAACFGAGFDTLAMQRAETLPSGRMRLVHRVVDIQAPHDGQPGRIIGEADIHRDDWFLTCHFIDDQVMPGTLMYECCLHTLRIYLLRMGWVGEQGQVAYQSVPGVCGKLKCRGQVIASTRTVRYQISIVKTDFMDDGTPYVIANALMLADGHPIVEMHNMSLSLQGLRREHIEALWHSATGVAAQASQLAPRQTVPTIQGASATALFNHASILAYAEGRPSDGFGERYRVFDEQRVLARLPRPPYLFMDQVDRIVGCEQWQLSAGGEIESTHQITPQDWYFAANRQHAVPLAILMEIALQPCGWLAAYLGSALTSKTDLSFRNLDGKATLHRALSAESGLLRAKTRINKVSSSGGMIIQTYSVTLHDAAGLLYESETVFGFFSKTALAQQIGVREAQWYAVENVIASPSGQLPYPAKTPFPDAQLRMLDHLSVLSLTGGRHGLGWVEGHAQVDPQAWYFHAHFYQDPVIPGSLGIESMAQLLKVYALERWSHLRNSDDPSAQFQCPANTVEMRWTYRGQVVPSNDRVSVQIHIARVDSATSTLFADGYLAVDGRIIYSVENISLRLRGGA